MINYLLEPYRAEHTSPRNACTLQISLKCDKKETASPVEAITCVKVALSSKYPSPNPCKSGRNSGNRVIGLIQAYDTTANLSLWYPEIRYTLN